MVEQFRKKSPEEILQSISRMHRGRLKIILGAVSGSGKTYHLLMEGQSLKKKEIDVVIAGTGEALHPKLTERLGGRFEKYEAVSKRKVFAQLVLHMNEKHATQVVIGQSARTRWKEIRDGSVIQRLLREVRQMDVLVVADHAPDTM